MQLVTSPPHRRRFLRIFLFLQLEAFDKKITRRRLTRLTRY